MGRRSRKGGERVLVVTPRPRIPFVALFRMFVLGSVAVLGAAYALWRHTTIPRPRMLEPVPAATEIPAPELVPLDVPP